MNVRVVGGADAEVAGESEGRSRLAAPRWLVVALAVLAVLGIVGTVVFGLAWNGSRQRDHRQSGALALSRQFALALTNWDAKTLNADFDRIIGYGTGDFLSKAQQTFDTRTRQAMLQRQVSSRGQLRYLFVEALKGSTADVYAVVDQTFINNQMKAPQADQLRLEMTLRRTGGAWRVAELTSVEGPTLFVPSGGSAPPATSSTSTTAPR